MCHTLGDCNCSTASLFLCGKLYYHLDAHICTLSMALDCLIRVSDHVVFPYFMTDLTKIACDLFLQP